MQALEPTNHVDFSRRYTLEEFLALPEREDHARYELIERELFLIPPPDPSHGQLASRLTQSLVAFLKANNIVGDVHQPNEPIYRRSEGSTHIEPDDVGDY